MEFQVGDRIGSYKLIRRLGQGGMGTVYEVVHEKLGTHYALKVFTLENGPVDLLRKKFLAEGKILARLSHPNLVHVFDLGVDGPTGKVYFVMDLIGGGRGESLRSLADVAPGSVDEEQILSWFSELCEALSYVHAQGVVHRDIKLNNILLSDDGHVVLSDFGISKVVDNNLRVDMALTKTLVTGVVSANFVMGTVGYMAPEVAAGRACTPASDVYSLAVVLFRLLTNVWYDPALAPPNATAGGRQISSISLLEMFNYNWKDVLPAMLDTDPLRRPQDLKKLPERVRAVHGKALREPSFKRRLFLGLAAVLFLAALGGLGWLVANRSRIPQIEPPATVDPPQADFEIEFFGHHVNRSVKTEDGK